MLKALCSARARFEEFFGYGPAEQGAAPVLLFEEGSKPNLDCKIVGMIMKVFIIYFFLEAVLNKSISE